MDGYDGGDISWPQAADGKGNCGIFCVYRRILNMRIMGLGFWLENSGVAVCDPLGITAQTVETSLGKMRIRCDRPWQELRN